MIALTTDPIDVASALKYLHTDQAGAIDLFLGIVRNSTQSRPVDRLEYEAYDRMAIGEMRKIADEANRRWPLLRYTIIHRTGTLLIGEMAVLIGVATAHRADAFDACRYIIDTIKQTVPIWKKEIFTDGEMWVNAHP
ncbi:molybdenum cofactor biosynthesis protein MoaE [Spirosoma montaniterrae]|uniref:Molybdopterin synthase catalytic subunit n=1 Tax=Spirosoma montaniterrae TaxID=1178516 RepID=A0A1P9WY56_9BACT|nr:molybdenum cofactor biosynthesis protein MoaE [Spirosoma montaniterrae]AQG80315.1 molybdenum cofactor biosynthesis protein MoaE [Spirosoma montaniterrae]